MRTFIPIAALLILCLGCAGPSFVSRPVPGEDPWLVRLQAYVEAGKAGGVRHDHPASWREEDLQTVLSRLYLAEQVGALDEKPAAKSVFTPEEVGRLLPAVREAFRLAQPSEWVTFFLAYPMGQGQGVTSGGLYLEGQRLHVIVANYREALPAGEEGREVKANPLLALKVRGRQLTFDPATYVVSTGSSWISGYGHPAGTEVVLDHGKFLASFKAAPAAAIQVEATQPARAGERNGEDLQATVKQLQAELDRLKRRLAEQEAELARLKSGPEASKKKPVPKQPVQ